MIPRTFEINLYLFSEGILVTLDARMKMILIKEGNKILSRPPWLPFIDSQSGMNWFECIISPTMHCRTFKFGLKAQDLVT